VGSGQPFPQICRPQMGRPPPAAIGPPRSSRCWRGAARGRIQNQVTAAVPPRTVYTWTTFSLGRTRADDRASRKKPFGGREGCRQNSPRGQHLDRRPRGLPAARSKARKHDREPHPGRGLLRAPRKLAPARPQGGRAGSKAGRKSEGGFSSSIRLPPPLTGLAPRWGPRRDPRAHPSGLSVDPSKHLRLIDDTSGWPRPVCATDRLLEEVFPRWPIGPSKPQFLLDPGWRSSAFARASRVRVRADRARAAVFQVPGPRTHQPGLPQQKHGS